MSSIPSSSRSLVYSTGNTPLVPIHKLVKPHKILPSKCEIHAKCEFRNPSGNIWDRLVCHEIIEKINASENFQTAFVTGGIRDLCLSLAWAGSAHDGISVAVLPMPNIDEYKLDLLQSFGANLIQSYQQDDGYDIIDWDYSLERFESHVRNLEATSGVQFNRILPFPPIQLDDSTIIEGPYDSLIEEVTIPEQTWDVIVCSGQDASLLQKLKKLTPTLISVDFFGNTFTEAFRNTREFKMEGVKRVHIVDGECYDMARRLVREEGLLVGPISGAVMAAAMKEASKYTESGSTSPSTSTRKRILVILPDSLHNSPKDFLSVNWMVEMGYYSKINLESLFWWYEMAVENINPPEVLITGPDTPARSVLASMKARSLERCVVVDIVYNVDPRETKKQAIGVVTREMLEEKIKRRKHGHFGVEDAMSRQFGLIDSKAKFSELEQLLRKHNWIVNMHRVPMHNCVDASRQDPVGLQLTTTEDVMGAINMADFISYKRRIESHHLTEYGLAMSDGVPSGVWLEKFNEQFKPVVPANDKRKGKIIPSKS